MKKKSVISTMLVLTMTVAQLTACGNNGDSGNGSTTGGAENTTVSTEVTKEEPGDNGKPGNEATTTVENGEKPENTEITSPAPVEARAALEEFVAGKGLLYFDKANVSVGYDAASGSHINAYEEGKGYNIYEVISTLGDNWQEENGGNTYLNSAKYAYIDCGQDGVQELVLVADFIENGMDKSEYFIIKEIDGKLQLCKSETYGYREVTDISTTGWINSSGSYSAAGGLSEDGFIDADGNYVFLYQMDYNYLDEDFTKSAEELYAAGDKEVLKENGDPLDVCVEKLSFTKDLAVDEENAENVFYTYYKMTETEEGGNIEEEDANYDESSPYYRIAINTGKKYVTPSEIGMMRDNREKELGVTDESRGYLIEKWEELKMPEDPRLVDENGNPRLYNNNGYFVQYDGKVYFHVPTEESMERTAIFDNFVDFNNGNTYLYSYDIKTNETVKEIEDHAWGPISVSGGKLMYAGSTADDPDSMESDTWIYYSDGPMTSYNLEEPEFCGGDEKGIYAVLLADYESYDGMTGKCYRVYRYGEAINDLYLGDDTEFLTIAGKSIIYLVDGEAKENGAISKHLMQADIDTGNITDLGELPEIEEGFGVCGQLEVKEDTLYLVYSVHDGSGDFFKDAYIITADLYCDYSLDYADYSSFEDISMASEYSSENTSENASEDKKDPSFIVEEEGPVITDGEPYTAGVIRNKIGYFGEAGEFIPVAEGYATVYDEEAEELSEVEACEYINGSIYLIKNLSKYAPEDDIGWRMAYRRSKVEVIKIDCESGEETALYSYERK